MRKSRQEYNKTYYDKHYKDKIYHILLQTVTCPNCQTDVMYCNLSRHKKSKKHIQVMEKQKEESS